MNHVRVSVEWLFGNIVNYFKSLKRIWKLDLFLKMYVVGALLRNALTCLYKNITSMYFELNPLAL
jgi:hypothetical protein